jgi:hypothetical protein
MAIGTEAGELFIADGSDLKSTVHSACPGEAVESITPHGKVGIPPMCSPLSFQSQLI